MPDSHVLIEVRDYIEERIVAMEKRVYDRLTHDREALQLQAREYERRLEGLNHENARILAAQSDAIRKEVYDAGKKELEIRMDNASREISVRFDSSIKDIDLKREETIRRITVLEQASIVERATAEEHARQTSVDITERNRRTTITLWAIGVGVTFVNIAIGILIKVLFK